MDTCRRILAQRNECKASLGLKPNSCYPLNYDGRCGEYEEQLKICLAWASCAESARLVYDIHTPRAARLKANKDLVKCLKRKHGDELGGIPKPRGSSQAEQ